MPIRIDGTDITGATIDGTDVQEITVDGQTVFSAQTLPVAYSDMIGWWPYDSGTYGGSNADDVTAIIGGSADDTAYDGNVSGATYQSSGGVTDIQLGANSGAFDYSGGDQISYGAQSATTPPQFTYMAWGEVDTSGYVWGFGPGNDSTQYASMRHIKDSKALTTVFGTNFDSFFNFVGYHHYCITYDGTNAETFIDAISQGTYNPGSRQNVGNELKTGRRGDSFDELDGRVDDFRLYNRALSATEIDQIYQNKKP